MSIGMLSRAAERLVDGKLVRALLWANDEAEARALSAILAAAGFSSFATDSSRVVGVITDDPEGLARTLGDHLDATARRAIKSLIFDGRKPGLADFSRIETVDRFIHHHSTRWLVELIDEKRYKSWMQPIVAAADGAIHGHEFLLRGFNRDGSIVPPVEMFGAATGLLSALLDSAARDSAIRTAAHCKVEGNLFINVLPTSVSVAQSAFADTLDLVEAAGIEPARVVFEIVESEAVEDIAHLGHMIDFCRSAGYRIALDDFGSGFNNLTMLIGLQPDYIKLDKSLISRISDESPIWTLTANMIDAARQSGVLVIAEGVEDEKTARLLRSLGADYMQGYHFGRPQETPAIAG